MVLVSTDFLDEVLAYLIASYFVFNIKYPKAYYPLLLFLQHAVFHLMDDQVVPITLSTFLSCMS